MRLHIVNLMTCFQLKRFNKMFIAMIRQFFYNYNICGKKVLSEVDIASAI